MINTQAGNVFFIILIVVILFAGLSYAVTQSSRSGLTDISKEQDKLDQTVSENCQINVDQAVLTLEMMNGCTSLTMNYVLPSGVNNNVDAPLDGSCDVFYPGPGGASPCGAYLDADSCDLTNLALGEKCPSNDIVYAGDSAGARIYTTSTDHPGGGPWSTVSEVTGASSTSDGVSNTDAIIASNGTTAAQTCRNIGAEWYLPSINELSVLHGNQNTIGGFSGKTAGGFFPYYVSSTEVSANGASYIHFNNGLPYNGCCKTTVDVSIRCIRKD